jgi:hypothetical protein
MDPTAQQTTSTDSTSVRKWIEAASPQEINEFREFLHEHFNHENLTFYVEVEGYRKLSNPDEVMKASVVVVVVSLF